MCAAGLAFVGVVPVAAAEPDVLHSADQVEQHVAESAPKLKVVAAVTQSDRDIVAVGAESSTMLPDEGSGAVTIHGESGVVIEVGLPTVTIASEAVIARGGSVVYSDPTGRTDVVVQPTDTGARLQTVINGPDAPVAYTYALDPSITPQLNGDGSVSLFVEVGGIAYAAGQVDVPWALDANGSPISTHFVVEQGSLRQIVEHTSRPVAYPVVADPAFQADCGFVTCTVRFDRARTKWLGSHPSERDLIATLGCIGTGVVTEVIGGVVCGVIAAVIVYHANKAASYYAQGKCYSYRFSWISPGLGVAAAVTRNTYNCK